jgi:hypothetical protein
MVSIFYKTDFMTNDVGYKKKNTFTYINIGYENNNN